MPLTPGKQSGQQRHVPFQRRSQRLDAELGLARRIVVRRDGTEIGLLDPRNASRTKDLFDLLQERAGQQRLRRLVQGGVTQIQTFVGPGDRLVEQQHLLVCAFAAGRKRQARVDQAPILGVAVESVVALGQRKDLLRKSRQKQIRNAQRANAGRREDAHVSRFVARVSHAFAAQDIQERLNGRAAIQLDGRPS